jgi:hypothetical protein
MVIKVRAVDRIGSDYYHCICQVGNFIKKLLIASLKGFVCAWYCGYFKSAGVAIEHAFG